MDKKIDNKITPCVDYWLKSLDTGNLELTNQNSIKDLEPMWL